MYFEQLRIFCAKNPAFQLNGNAIHYLHPFTFMLNYIYRHFADLLQGALLYYIFTYHLM